MSRAAATREHGDAIFRRWRVEGVRDARIDFRASLWNAAFGSWVVAMMSCW